MNPNYTLLTIVIGRVYSWSNLVEPTVTHIHGLLLVVAYEGMIVRTCLPTLQKLRGHYPPWKTEGTFPLRYKSEGISPFEKMSSQLSSFSQPIK